APVQVGLGAHVEGVLHHETDLAREGVGHDALALDDACVTKARLLARTAPVEEGDRAAALLQMQGRGDANHARAQHDDIGVAGTVQVLSLRFAAPSAAAGWAFPHYMTNLRLMRQTVSATRSWQQILGIRHWATDTGQQTLGNRHWARHWQDAGQEALAPTPAWL